MKKWFKILFVLLIIGAFVYKNFVYTDEQYYCSIKVLPSFQPSNWDFRKVFTLLKQTAPEEYKYMCANVSTISKDMSCGGFDGGCYYTEQRRTLYIGNDQDNIAVTVAVIIHELCHARQNNEGRPLIESECYQKAAVYLNGLYSY
jgi:hypothetical protein